VTLATALSPRRTSDLLTALRWAIFVESCGLPARRPSASISGIQHPSSSSSLSVSQRFAVILLVMGLGPAARTAVGGDRRALKRPLFLQKHTLPPLWKMLICSFKSAAQRFRKQGRRGEMADARDLKSLTPKGVCGFESRRRQLPNPRRLNNLRSLMFR
jgi:hypothetical protein